jgi:hypothetical protein
MYMSSTKTKISLFGLYASIFIWQIVHIGYIQNYIQHLYLQVNSERDYGGTYVELNIINKLLIRFSALVETREKRVQYNMTVRQLLRNLSKACDSVKWNHFTAMSLSLVCP